MSSQRMRALAAATSFVVALIGASFAQTGCDARIEPAFRTPTGSPTATPTPEPAGPFRFRITYELAENLEHFPVAIWVEKADTMQTYLRTVEITRPTFVSRSALFPQWWKKTSSPGPARQIPLRAPGTYVTEWNGRLASGQPALLYDTYLVLVETTNFGLPETDDWLELRIQANPFGSPPPTPVAAESILLRSVSVEVLP